MCTHITFVTSTQVVPDVSTTVILSIVLRIKICLLPVFYETERICVINKPSCVLLMCLNLQCGMSDILQILMYVRLLFLNLLPAIRKIFHLFYPLATPQIFLPSVLHSVTVGWIWGSNPSGGEIFRTHLVLYPWELE